MSINNNPKRLLFGCNKGFTLIEIIIVLMIISVMSLLVVPRISNIFDSKRNNFFILTTVIAKTFDDSFINGRLNFLMIHLHEPMSDVEDEGIYSRTNGISVVTLNEQGKLIERKKKLLQYRNFPDSFKIENVVLSTGENIGVGNVLVPFYPDGYSDNVIIHILINEEEQWSVRIYKLGKEAKIFPDYINFDERV